jgi:hypothetical protein
VARERLEFHHRHPYGYGGECSIDNICLMCRTHNVYLAERDYGRRESARTTQPAAPDVRGVTELQHDLGG